MKKTGIAVFAVMLFALSIPAAADQTTLNLYSGATGTTSQVTGDVVYSPIVAGSAGCDIKTSPTVTVVVVFKGGNAFRGVETFDSSGLTTSVTCTTGVCNKQFTANFIAMQSLITASTTTAVVNVNCSVR